jgi:hypothetical protein
MSRLYYNELAGETPLQSSGTEATFKPQEENVPTWLCLADWSYLTRLPPEAMHARRASPKRAAVVE